MTDEAPLTFYSATVVPHKPRPRLAGEVDADVCVVGGGFAGLWTAWALARRGRDVVLIEAGTIAGGASGRNGGFVSAGYAERIDKIVDRVGLPQARALYDLSRDGIDIVRDMLAEGVAGVDPVPGRLNVLRYHDEEGLRRQADFFSEHFGHEMLVWPTERVRETLKTRRYYQALHDADAFSVHPLNLAIALAAELERLGVRIFEHTAATGADLDGVWKWVATASGRVRAHHVVFSGSAQIGEAFPDLADTVLPVSTYVCVTKPMGEALGDAIRYAGGVADTRRAGDYYRVIGDRLLWGGRITTKTALPRNLGRVLARDIRRVYPQLVDVQVEYAWSGVMGYAIHRMPQIGPLRPNVWIASAFGGHGLNTAAIAGELVASGITEHDDRWRHFIPFGLVWNGGTLGRRLTQVAYWSMSARDRFDEAMARVNERLDKQRRARAVRAREQAIERKLHAQSEAERKQRVAAEISARVAARVEDAARGWKRRMEEEEARPKAPAAVTAAAIAEEPPEEVPVAATAIPDDYPPVQPSESAAAAEKAAVTKQEPEEGSAAPGAERAVEESPLQQETAHEAAANRPVAADEPAAMEESAPLEAEPVAAEANEPPAPREELPQQESPAKDSKKKPKRKKQPAARKRAAKAAKPAR